MADFLFAAAAGSQGLVTDSLAAWVGALRLPLGDIHVTDKKGTTDITNLTLHDIQLPLAVVDRNGPTSFRLGISDAAASVNIAKIVNTAPGDVLRWLIGMQTLELRDFEATVAGSFTANISVKFAKPMLIEVTDCVANTRVTSLQDVKAQAGWLHNLDPTGAIGQAIDELIKKEIAAEFDKRICDADGLSEQLEDMLDKYIADAEDLQRNNSLRNNNTVALRHAYQWQDAPVYKWLRAFYLNAGDNGFSWKSFFDTAFSGSNADRALCLFGTRAGVSCPFPPPAALTATVDLPTSSGGSISFKVANLTLMFRSIAVEKFEIPKVNDDHPQWLGLQLDAGPINSLLAVDLEMVYRAQDVVSRVRKTISLELDVESIALEAYVFYEVDAAKFQALSQLQRVTPACLDGIANQFRVTYYNQTVRLRRVQLGISPPRDSGDAEDEGRCVASLQKLANVLMVTGINSNPDKINKFINAVIAPALETIVNTQGGFSGLLDRLGVKEDPLHPGLATTLTRDDCPRDGESSAQFALRTGALVTFLVALFLYVGFKAFGPDGARRGGVSLAMKRSTGRHWPLALPCLIVTAFLLFISSNAMVAGAMNLYLLQDGQQPIVITSLKSFSVVESVLDLWRADMKLLAILIFMFSIVLPYVKLAASLFIFFGPVSSQVHGQFVKVLDMVGKWSLLDAFVLLAIVSLTSMRIPLHGGQGIAMYVEPEWGFVAFILGTILALLIGNILLALHRRAHREEVPATELPATSWLTRWCRTPKVALFIFIAIFVLSFAYIIVGSFLTFCSVELQGLFGFFLKYVHERLVGENSIGLDGNRFDFSMVGLGTRLSVVTAGNHPWQTVFLQLTYFGFAIVVPCLFLLVAVAICIRSLCSSTTTRTGLYRLQTIGHTLYAWSAVDVYMVGAMVTVVEMGLVPALKDAKGTEQWISKVVRPVADIPGEVNQILRVSSTLRVGAICVLAGALLQVGAGFVFLRNLPWLQQLGVGDYEPACVLDTAADGRGSSDDVTDGAE